MVPELLKERVSYTDVLKDDVSSHFSIHLDYLLVCDNHHLLQNEGFLIKIEATLTYEYKNSLGVRLLLCSISRVIMVGSS